MQQLISLKEATGNIMFLSSLQMDRLVNVSYYRYGHFYFIFSFACYSIIASKVFVYQVTRNPDTPPGRFSPQEQATVNSIVAAR